MSDDREYWWRQSPDDRLAAVETMRQTLCGYDPAPGRLQRPASVTALRAFGFTAPVLTTDLFLKADQITRMGKPPFRIEIDGLPVPVIDLASLRRNKKASGRFKDLDDLENLPLDDHD